MINLPLNQGGKGSVMKTITLKTIEASTKTRGTTRLSIDSLFKTTKTYLELTKPRIVLLLLFTMVTAMIVAANGIPSPRVLIAGLLAGGLAAGGASALNQYFDRDIDARMSSTARRPIPSGRLRPARALIFGLSMVVLSLALFWLWTNLLTAALVLLGELYYVVLYTLLLKRNSSINIVIGGGAGALPVLIGWSAVTGTVDLGAWLLLAIIFLWTPPHSWALALLVNTDYARAGIPMMPVAKGEPTTRRQILFYTILLVAASLLPVAVRQAGVLYLVAAVLLGVGMIEGSIRLIRKGDKATARVVYKYSTTYLALIFLVMSADKLIHW